MRSLRLRIALAVIVVAVPLIAGLAALLYREVSRTIHEELDRQLVEDARLISDLVEYEPGEGIELDFGPVVQSFARQRATTTWWRLWGPDGEVIAADPSSGWMDPPPKDREPALYDAVAENGASTRVVAMRFVPHADEEEHADDGGGPDLAIAVARETRQVDALLDELATLFWLLGTATCLLVGGVAAWQVARGLAPTRRLGAELERLGPRDAGRELDTSTLPVELVPFVRRLNALLQRLRSALAREREFTSHVAHELRTPLTVLRTSLDIAGRREPSLQPQLREMLRTVDEMSALVDNLLTLARVEGGAEPLQRDTVDVQALVDEVWREVAEQAAARRLKFENRLPPTTVKSDAGKLRIVLRNVLANATSYTEEGGTIAVEANDDELLSVWDSGPQLTDDELARVFDRMWRSDPARTDAAVHAGIGLSLARALCDALGIALTVKNESDGGLRFRLARPAPDASRSGSVRSN